jgi:4-amino-4-deoxy-L-arabinose transferase-like glycosyltransferase
LSTGLRSIATAGLLSILAFGLFAVRIGDRPLTPGELDVVRLAGHTTSLFFEVGDDRWLQPLAVYATSLVANVSAPENAGRLAAAAIGGLNVALMFLLVQRLLSSTSAGVGSALLLMATPAHLVFARTGVDAIYPMPFVLAWVMALNLFFETGSRRFAVAGAFVLGIGVYSTASGPLTMGFLLIATLGAIWRSGRRDLASFAIPVAAFVAPLGVAVIWFVANPSAYPDTFGRWAIHAAHLRSPVDLVRALVNWNTLGTRASLYWGFFDPSWLFLDGAPAPSVPLRGAAPFLFATVIALANGLATRLKDGASPITFLLLSGVAVAPLAAATFGAPHAIADAIVVVPLVLVLAAAGLTDWLKQAGWRRWLAGATMIAMVIDAARFVANY